MTFSKKNTINVIRTVELTTTYNKFQDHHAIKMYKTNTKRPLYNPTKGGFRYQPYFSSLVANQVRNMIFNHYTSNSYLMENQTVSKQMFLNNNRSHTPKNLDLQSGFVCLTSSLSLCRSENAIHCNECNVQAPHITGKNVYTNNTGSMF